jgi:hypothetical protein
VRAPRNQTLACWGQGATSPTALGAPNIMFLGDLDNGGGVNDRYITSYGKYRSGTQTRVPNCGLLQYRRSGKLSVRGASTEPRCPANR